MKTKLRPVTAPIPNAVSVRLEQLPAFIKSAGGGTVSGFKSAQGIAAGRYGQAKKTTVHNQTR